MSVRLRTTDFRRESGQVVVLFAILLPVLFGLGAIVLDIGNWYVHKRHLQTQVDAAALAAATGFRACFFDAASANLGIASVALSYAGDTARDPDARNQQVQVPGAVRVTLNSQRYWAKGDSSTPTSNGYGTATDPVGDGSAGTPCATSTLDVKATDTDVPKLFSWLGIRPDIKAHARIEIRKVKAESGFLPLAVPEIDPNYVYAIYVDYSKDGTQTPLLVQELKKGTIPTLAGTSSSFPYSGWIPKTESEVPGNTKVFLPQNKGTGVVLLVSKSDVAPSKGGTLNAICTQAPTDLVQCYAGTGAAGYNGAATGQGLSFIYSHATAAGAPINPVITDVRLTGMVCPPGAGAGNLSGPYYVNDDNDCTVGVSVDIDFGSTGSPPNGDVTARPNQGGVCAKLTSNANLSWTSTSGKISTWDGSLSVPVAGGPQVVTISGWTDQDLRD